MKKIIYILVVIFIFSNPLLAQAERTIHVETAGTLKELLGGEISTISNLTLTGTISHVDFSTLKSMGQLQSLDLGAVTVQEASIPNYAFDWRTFQTLVLPRSVKTIGEQAFRATTIKNAFVLPEGLQSIGTDAFWMAKFSSIDFSQATNLQSLGYDCFCDVTIESGIFDLSAQEKLTAINQSFKRVSFKVILPQNMKKVPNNAFAHSYCEVVFPEGVESIGSTAFLKYVAPASFRLPGTLKTIEYQSFRESTIKSTLIMPESLQSIGEDAFWMAKIHSVDFSQAVNLETLGFDSFCDVTLESGVFDLSKQDKLTTMVHPFKRIGFKVTLPEKMKRLPDNAFRYSKCEVIAPEGLEVVGSSAFVDYTSPTGNVQLPGTVNMIENNAFENAKFNEFIISRETPPFLGKDVFKGVDQAAIPLKIPETDETILAYGLASQWKNFQLPVGNLTVDSYEQGAKGEVLISIRANDNYWDYAIMPWDYDTNTASSDGRIEGTYPTIGVGEYEWTTRNLKLKYDPNQDRSWVNYSLNFVEDKLGTTNFTDGATDAQKIRAFEELYGTWMITIDGAISYREPKNRSFVRKDANYDLENINFDLPDMAAIMQMIGQIPSSNGITNYEDLHNFVIGYPEGSIDYIKDKDALPGVYEKRYQNTSGLNVTLLGDKQGTVNGTHSQWNHGFRWMMKEDRGLRFSSDFTYFMNFNPNTYHYGSARYCRQLTDEELGYKLYIDNCNDAVVMYPVDQKTRLTELPRGLERGVALKYANRSKMKIYRKWSEICTESDLIRKNIKGAPPREELPESPCEYPNQPEPYEKGKQGEVLISIRANDNLYDYAIMPWDYDTNMASSNGRIEGSYPTIGVGEYEWTTRNLKLKYDPNQDHSWVNHPIEFVKDKLGDNNFTDGATDAQKISAFENLYGTWTTSLPGALSYREPQNRSFTRKDSSYESENVNFDLPDMAAIMQMIGQTPASNGITDYYDFHDFIVGYPEESIDYIKDKEALPGRHEKDFSNTSGLNVTMLGERWNKNVAEPYLLWNDGFRWVIKEGAAAKFGNDFVHFMHFNLDNYKYGSVRYCRQLTDEELGYKIYVDNCNDSIVMYPLDKETKLTELPRGLERGVALRYANRMEMKIYRKWSEVCAEAELIRKNVAKAPEWQDLPLAPCGDEPEPEPDPEWEQIIANPSKDQNYIHTKTYTREDSTQWIDKIQYFDGLGRPNQLVQVGVSPGAGARKDLVTLQEYDAYGRERNTWLPGYGTGLGVFTDYATVKNSAIELNLNDQRPYSFPIYESSPLNRVEQQYGPGDAWQNNGKSVKTAYLTNDEAGGVLTCNLYTITGSGMDTKVLNDGKQYAAGELYVTQITDEDGNIQYEFKDKLGQVVLTRSIVDEVLYSTYYVYDDFGNLCYVIPPKLASLSTVEFSENETYSKQLAYIYKFDGRNRCIWKKLPGADPIYYIYDKADQLVFSQDGEQRKDGQNQWTFSIADAFGRMVLSGICENELAVGDVIDAVVRGVATEDTSGTYKGYTLEGISLAGEVSLYTVNYYDNYRFIGESDLGFDTTQGEAYNQWYENAKGLLTGSLVATLGGETPDYLQSALYYDSKGRLIQTRSTNHLKGKESEYVAYNFSGQPIEKLHIHQVKDQVAVSEKYNYSYDYAGRLVNTRHSLDGKPEQLIAANQYDELGRLKSNKKGNKEDLTTTYDYNIRSWTKAISSPLFTQNLQYNDADPSIAQYGGNIAAMTWQIKGDVNRSYSFAYDQLSRLTKANYADDRQTNNYELTYGYDLHGNITNRHKKGGEADITLTNTYANQGNQLTTQSLSSSVVNPQNDPMTYNFNGALVSNPYGGITKIEYNSLNLPKRIRLQSDGVDAENRYVYTADGQKLRNESRWNPQLTQTPIVTTGNNVSIFESSEITDYVGNKVYKDGTLKMILIDGGYIQEGKYHYYLSDHLGNNRVVATAEGQMIQQTHYEPFGASFDEQGLEKQPYLYNGKEYDGNHGLNLYDYLARLYAQEDGRFTSIDPLAELHFDISPYVYVKNNPLRFIDPTGMIPKDSVNWDTFDPTKEDIDLNEVVVTANKKNENENNISSQASWKQGSNGYEQNSGVLGLIGSLATAAEYKGGHLVAYINNTKVGGPSLTYYGKNQTFRARPKFRKIPIDLSKTGKVVGKGAGVLSLGVITYDIIDSQQIKVSHVINGAMAGLAMTGFGAPIAAAWFIVDVGSGLIFGVSLSEHIDNTIGSPLYEWE